METIKGPGKGSKRKTICLVGITLMCAAFTIYNLLPKLMPLGLETSPPIYFQNSKGFYWIWNDFEMQGPSLISKVIVQSNVQPPSEDEYLVPLTASEFENHAWNIQKNKIFLQSLVNLHTKTISDGKHICGNCGLGWVNCTSRPRPVHAYEGYEEGSYFGERLSEVLSDGAILSLKILSVGSNFREKSQCPRKSLSPTNRFDIQTVTKLNLTTKPGPAFVSNVKTQNNTTNKNFDDLAKISFCNVVHIPLTVNNEFKEIGYTRLFFIPFHYKRKSSSWLTWVYTIVTEPFRYFFITSSSSALTLPSPSSSVSSRCFHSANFLPYNKYTKYNYLPETFSSIMFCH